MKMVHSPDRNGDAPVAKKQRVEGQLPSCSQASSAVRRVLCSDISCGQEAHPIPVVNELPDQTVEPPEPFTYLRSGFSYSEAATAVLLDKGDSDSDWSCDCVGVSCVSNPDCACVKLNQDHRCAYDQEGRLTSLYRIDVEHAPFPDSYECGDGCACPADCGNRVVQRGIRFRLEVFRTTNRGFGLRTLDRIPRGSFVMQYTGELLTDAEAEAREDDSYNYEAPMPSFTVDAKFVGNASRFINQSCEANVKSKRVSWNDEIRIGIFAHRRDIEADEELTVDYGAIYWNAKIYNESMYCLCGLAGCRYDQQQVQKRQQQKIAQDTRQLNSILDDIPSVLHRLSRDDDDDDDDEGLVEAGQIVAELQQLDETDDTTYTDTTEI